MPFGRQSNKKIARPIPAVTIDLPAFKASTPLSFATSAVPVAPFCNTTAVAEQLVPQAYPLGQHPPPSPFAQLNHPTAQPLAPNAASPVPLGMTDTVTPFELIARVDEAAGQEVKPQSRPTRQQPGCA